MEVKILPEYNEQINQNHFHEDLTDPKGLENLATFYLEEFLIQEQRGVTISKTILKIHQQLRLNLDALKVCGKYNLHVQA